MATRRRLPAEPPATTEAPVGPSGLTHFEIERLMSEDPDDRAIREAHGFTYDDDWQDETLLCRNGCGWPYPEIAIAKMRKCYGPSSAPGG
jgi:hypothetical protein